MADLAIYATLSDPEFATYVRNAREFKPQVMTLPTDRVLTLVDRLDAARTALDAYLAAEWGGPEQDAAWNDLCAALDD